MKAQTEVVPVLRHMTPTGNERSRVLAAGRVSGNYCNKWSTGNKRRYLKLLHQSCICSVPIQLCSKLNTVTPEAHSLVLGSLQISGLHPVMISKLQVDVNQPGLHNRYLGTLNSEVCCQDGIKPKFISNRMP